MKHGIKLRKLQRTSSHRYALLRNLVSALLHHEAIKTTIPKAKEAARMAEKIITLGKKGTDPARRAAVAFLMPGHHTPQSVIDKSFKPPPKPLDYPTPASSSSLSENPEEYTPTPSLFNKLFQTLSTRYNSRPGGYTRIQKYGRRPGDNAPVCILSLVDGPRDLKFEMVARAVGKETVYLGTGSREGMERILQGGEEGLEGLRERTRRGVEKVLMYRGEEGRRELFEKAGEYADTLLAEETALGGHRRKLIEEKPRPKNLAVRGITVPYQGRRHFAGERMPGMPPTQTGLGLARGELGRKAGNHASKRVPKFLSEVGRRDVVEI